MMVLRFRRRMRKVAVVGSERGRAWGAGAGGPMEAMLKSESSTLEGGLRVSGEEVEKEKGGSQSIGVRVADAWWPAEDKAVQTVRVVEVAPQSAAVFCLERAGC